MHVDIDASRSRPKRETNVALSATHDRRRSNNVEGRGVAVASCDSLGYIDVEMTNQRSDSTSQPFKTDRG